jgi:hypothetical protein
MESRPNKPTPESAHKPHSPEPGAGPLGKPPPAGPERDLRGQGEEGAPARGGHESTHVQQPEEEMSKLARENEEFFKKLRRINPEGRERAQKRLLDYLFSRRPQDPKQEK